MKFGLVYYVALFAIECATWWAPYFFGASQKLLDIYTRVHSKTINLLPRRERNPMPNLEHLILMGLTLLAAASTWIGYREICVGPIPSLWIGWVVGIFLTVGTASQMVGNAKIPNENITQGS